LDSNLRQRLFRGTLWLTIGSFGTKALSLASSVVLARVLGRTGLGEFGAVYSTLFMFEAVASFGMNGTAARHVARWRTTQPRRAAMMVGFTCRIAAVTGLVLAAMMTWLAPWISSALLSAPHICPYIRIGSLVLVFMALDAAQTGSLMGFEATRAIAVVGIGNGIVYPVVMVSAALLDGVRGAVWGAAVCAGLKYCLNRYYLRQELAGLAQGTEDERVAHYDWPVLWKFSVPTVMAGLLVAPVAWACNAWLVRQPGGYAALGVLGVAASWMQIVTFLPSNIGTLAMPVLSNLLGDNDRSGFRQALLYKVMTAATAAVVTALPIALLANQVLRLYGQEYADGAPVLMLSCAVAVMTSILAPLGAPITSAGMMWVSFALNAIWAAVCLGGAFLLIPAQGAMGLLKAQLVAYACLAVLVTLTVRLLWRRVSAVPSAPQDDPAGFTSLTGA